MSETKRFIGVVVGVVTAVLSLIPLHPIGSRASAQANNTLCRIMPLGDSITYDHNVCDVLDPNTALPTICDPALATLEFRRSPGQRTGYRKHLLELLKAAGYKHHVDFDFVGSEKGGGNIMVDPDNAGFPGITIAQLMELLDTGTYQNDQTQLWLDTTKGEWWGDQWVEEQELPTPIPPYLETYPADIILLHIGTNSIPRNGNQDPTVLDSSTKDAIDTETQNVANILMEIDEYERTHNKVMVIVAGIINRACSLSSQYNACQQDRLPTTKFNESVNRMVTTRIAAGDDIIWVDMEMGAQIVYNRPDMIDEWHPDKSGYQKMALVWKNALVTLVNIQLPPNCFPGDFPPPTPPTNLRIIN